MSKRRTKKQKLSAKHQFAISWEPGKVVYENKAENGDLRTDVKDQFNSTPKTKIKDLPRSKYPDNTEEITNLSTIKKDIIKSLVLACFILGTELVIYLVL